MDRKSTWGRGSLTKLGKKLFKKEIDMRHRKILGSIVAIFLFVSCAKISVTSKQVSDIVESVLSSTLSGTMAYLNAKYPDSVAVKKIPLYAQYAYTDITMMVHNNTVTIASVTNDIAMLFNQINSELNIVDPQYASIFVAMSKSAALAINNLWVGKTIPTNVSEFALAVANGINAGVGGNLTPLSVFARDINAYPKTPFYIDPNGKILW